MAQWLPNELISLHLDSDDSLSVTLSIWMVLIVGLILVSAVAIARRGNPFRRLSEFEIDEATLGIGEHRIKLRPNDLDRQIAYAIWVELSTRKLGLPVDPKHDVIVDIYDSWYHFFGISRELVKSIPVTKVRRADTLKVVELSMQVLNEGLRPHLTRWQSRFRHWLKAAQEKQPDVSLQELQSQFPDYEELISDMMSVSQRMQVYRAEMYRLAVE